MGDLAVTGSTGRLGGRVARRLAAAGRAQRLIVRDPTRAPELPAAVHAGAEYGDAAARAALSGVDTLFMVSGAETLDLADPTAHKGATYELTGPRAITMAEAAAALAASTGRPIRFENETLDEAYASRAQYGAPEWQVTAWVTTYTAVAAGDLESVTDDVQRLTGHPPRGLEDVL